MFWETYSPKSSSAWAMLIGHEQFSIINNQSSASCLLSCCVYNIIYYLMNTVLSFWIMVKSARSTLLRLLGSRVGELRKTVGPSTISGDSTTCHLALARWFLAPVVWLDNHLARHGSQPPWYVLISFLEVWKWQENGSLSTHWFRDGDVRVS